MESEALVVQFDGQILTELADAAETLESRIRDLLPIEGEDWLLSNEPARPYLPQVLEAVDDLERMFHSRDRLLQRHVTDECEADRAGWPQPVVTALKKLQAARSHILHQCGWDFWRYRN